MASGLGIQRQRGMGLNVLLALACVVIIVAGLKAASELFIPIMLGAFLALLSMPVLTWVHNRGVPRPLAILLTILFDVLIVGALVYLAIAVISRFQDRKDYYAVLLKEQAIGISETVDKQLQEFSGFWDKFGVDLPEPGANSEGQTDPGTQTGAGDAGESENGAELLTLKEVFERYWDANRIVELIGQTELIGRVTSLASKSFFVFIIMIFVLAESGGFSQKLKDVIRVRGPDLRRIQNSSRDIGKYLAIKTGVSAVTGLLAWVVCTSFRVDFPELWGLVAFLFNFIPAVGSILAAIPPIILALVDTGVGSESIVVDGETVQVVKAGLDVWRAFGVFICYLVINISFGNFLEPMLLGDRFGISTVMVILSVLVWGYIWGPVGMFLAVPLTMLMKVLLENSPDLRWISVLMGKRTDDVLRERRKLARRVMGKKSEETEPVVPPETPPASSEGAAS